MENEKQILSQEGFDKYKEELKKLETIDKPAVINALSEARAQGDLSENADYDAARNKQAQIEARINEINYILENSKVVDGTSNNKTIGMFSSVTYLDLSDNTEYKFKIVSSVESNLDDNKIDVKSPLGIALSGHKKGDVVSVDAPHPYEVKILQVN